TGKNELLQVAAGELTGGPAMIARPNVEFPDEMTGVFFCAPSLEPRARGKTVTGCQKKIVGQVEPAAGGETLPIFRNKGQIAAPVPVAVKPLPVPAQNAEVPSSGRLQSTYDFHQLLLPVSSHAYDCQNLA